jgi:hypothetical protein
MTHYIIEVALWVLALFFAGCLFGGLARHLFGASAPAAEAPRKDEPEAESPQA